LNFCGKSLRPTADKDLTATSKERESRLQGIVELMPQLGNVQPLSKANMNAGAAKTESASQNQNGKSKSNGAASAGSTLEIARVPKGVKTVATGTLAANIAQQRALLTKKPEGIQISRSKHWKFISSYHGPYHPIAIVR
jgi:hypothetical protein